MEKKIKNSAYNQSLREKYVRLITIKITTGYC